MLFQLNLEKWAWSLFKVIKISVRSFCGHIGAEKPKSRFFLSNILKSMHILWTNIDNHSPYILNDLSIVFAHLQWWGILFWLQNCKFFFILWIFQGAASFLVTEGWNFKNLPNISSSEMFLSNMSKSIHILWTIIYNYSP